MALPFEIRVRYVDAMTGREHQRQVRKADAKGWYSCHGCWAAIGKGEAHWYGAKGERLCLDCPNVRVVGKVAA